MKASWGKIEADQSTISPLRRLVEGEISKMQPLIFTAHSVASERHPERNEDSFIADQESGLAGVFDGVGVAAQATFSASQMAARVFLQEWKQFIQHTQPGHTFLTLGPQDTSIDLKAPLRKMTEKINMQIRAAQKRN